MKLEAFEKPIDRLFTLLRYVDSNFGFDWNNFIRLNLAFAFLEFWADDSEAIEWQDLEHTEVHPVVSANKELYR